VAVVATLSKGYDLGYIWKQVDRGSVKDAASYYIQASESGGEPPGRWWGPGARALGFENGQMVEREPYDLLFGERKAPDGTQLGRPPSNGRKAADLYVQLLSAEPHATAERKRELRAEAVKKARPSPLFFDLTISFSKSTSIFHASLGESARLARQAGDKEGDKYWSALVTEVDDMIWQAVLTGFEYFQREAGYTRTGSHNARVHGRESGQWHEADLAVAHWLQHTSRDGDMQLHVHSQIAHVARTGTDGKWRAPDSLGYNEHIGAVAAIVSQHLEEALTRRFGLEWTARDDGHGFEIKGISGEMMRMFSSRRESITADLRGRATRFEQRYGRKPSSANWRTSRRRPTSRRATRNTARWISRRRTRAGRTSSLARSPHLVPPRLPPPNPTGGQPVITGHQPLPAASDQADRRLAAVAAGVTGHGLSPRLARIGDVPVLTIEESTGGPDPTSVSINPDLSVPGLSLECTFLWTLPSDVPSEAIADTIIAVLNAVRPLAVPHRPGDRDLSPR
jgi:TrwC relaxase